MKGSGTRKKKASGPERKAYGSNKAGRRLNKKKTSSENAASLKRQDMRNIAGPSSYKADGKKHAGYGKEIAGILMLSAGVLMLLSFYAEKSIGPFGSFIKSFLAGMVGLPAFFIPPFVIVYSMFMIIRKDNTRFKLRALYSFILLLLLSAMVHIGGYRQEDYVNLTFLGSIGRFYSTGSLFHGGGVLGGMVSTPLIMMFQILGTVVILTALSVIDIILLTNISFGAFLRGIRDFAGRRRQNLSEAVETEKERPAGETDGYPSFGYAEYTGYAGNDIDFSRKRNIADFGQERETAPVPLPEPDDEPVEFLLNDIKREIASDINRIKPSGNRSRSSDEKEDTMKGSLKGTRKHDQAENRKEHDASRSAAGIGADAGIAANTVANTNSAAYRFPDINLLDAGTDKGKDSKDRRNTAAEGARKLEETLRSFGVEARVVNITRGPTVTRYELQPSPGVKVSRIVNLSDDIALNLASEGIRIEAHIPGKAAIGIEVPNKDFTPVMLREVLESQEFSSFQSKLAFALGKDISGECVIADIARMPHLLIAGSTGAGKSVCINNLIISLLYKASPEDVKLLLIDPKVVELGMYNSIPHLLIPVVTEPKKAAGALNWAVTEMGSRYRLFAEKGARDIKGYNTLLKSSGEESPLPQIVIVIDELADLMMAAPNEVEDAICRLAQMARAAGMHLVIATQRPSVDVITGLIKANIPSRISFAVASQVDSRTILDMAGAEKLLGRGDMLYYPVGRQKPVRIQGAYISDREIESVIENVKAQMNASYNSDIIDEIESECIPKGAENGDCDELLPQTIEMVIESGQASVSLIQRKFKVGYARAARIIDQMEERGIVGGYEGSKPRQVLVSRQQWQEMQMAGGK